MAVVACDIGNEGTVFVESFNGEEQVCMISNSNGRVVTGIYVGKDGDVSINPLAEQQALKNPSGYCNNFKALLGTGQTVFLNGVEYTPERLYAMYANALVEDYCANTGQNKADVKLFMTVPTKTDAPTVNRIVDECIEIGLDTRAKNVLSEAAAAAVNASKVLDTQVEGKKLVIADLGHGTLDLVCGTVRTVDDVPIFDIEKSIGHDIGGRDLDTVVLGMIQGSIRESTGLDFDEMNPQDRTIVRNNVRTLKEALSTKQSASRNIRLTSKDGSKVDVALAITVGDYVDAMKASGFVDILESKVDEILACGYDLCVLTGGPWKTPFLRNLVEEKASAKIVDVDPYYAVALGCGRHAIRITTGGSNLIIDRSRYAYSVTAKDEKVRAYVHIPKGAVRPASFTDVYRVPENFADILHTDIYTSDHTERVDFNPLDGSKLGTLEIPLPPGVKAHDKVEVTVDLLIDDRIEASAIVLGKDGPSQRVAIVF